MKRISFLIIFIVCIFFSCSEDSVLITKDTISTGKYKLRDDTILEDSLSHIKFSRLVDPKSFGMNGAYEIPEEFKHKALRIIYECKIRTNQVYTKSAIAIGITDSTKVIEWKAVSLRFAYTDVNAWCWYKDSAEFGPTKEDKDFVDISAYLNETKIEKFDIDSLLITIKYKL
jgi:hypothetical protein